MEELEKGLSLSNGGLGEELNLGEPMLEIIFELELAPAWICWHSMPLDHLMERKGTGVPLSSFPT